MKRWIRAYRTVTAPAAAVERVLLESSNELLQLAIAAPDEPVAVDGSFVAELEGTVSWFQIGKRVRIRTGVAHRPAGRVRLPLSWHAEPLAEVFPRFEGELEVQPLDSAYTQLTLSGRYGVPLGPLGWGVDRTVLRHVAQETAEQLVSGLASEIRRALAAEAAPAPPRHAPRRTLAQLQVRDVMTAEPLVLDEDTPTRDAALLLFEHGISGAPVVAADGALLGVLSEHDLLAKSGPTAGAACSKPAEVTVAGASVAVAARVMVDRRLKRLVVVDRGKVAGIVSRHDVLAALVRSDTELQATVQQVIDDLGHTQVRAEVREGAVTLRGATLIRSDAERVIAAVTTVDGVVEVDSADLKWLQDDRRPAVPTPAR